MSDYARANTGGATHFGDKDALTTGDADKVIVGSQFDTEFNAVVTAVATKYDSDDLASSAEAQAETLNTKLITPLRLSNWSEANAGMVADLHALADPGTDSILGWDDSAGAVIAFGLGTGMAIEGGTNFAFNHLGLQLLSDPGADRIVFWDDSANLTSWLTVGTGLDLTGTDLTLSHLGIESLTDPGADGLFAWDDTAGAAAFFTAADGLSFDNGASTIGITDVTPAAGQPIGISSGTFDFDLTAVDNIEGNALAATDEILVDDGGVVKAVAIQDLGLRVQTGQTTQTLAATDMNTIMQFAATATVTIPTNASVDLPVGVPIILNMKHATQELTVTASSGVDLVTVNHPGGVDNASDTVRAGGSALLYQIADDEWALTGNITD